MGGRARIKERVLDLVRKRPRGQGLSVDEFEQQASVTGDLKAVRSVIRDLLEEERLAELPDGTIGRPPLPEGWAGLEEWIDAHDHDEERRSGPR